MYSKINLNSKTFLVIFFLISFVILSAIHSNYDSPTPGATDDYSYLLAADTFAEGRVTNPPHQYWQFFENAHILSIPTHMSKYQPGYGAILALGQVIFGHTFYGVILATALFAASFFWMSKSILDKKFALFGAFFILVYFGIFSYWGISYFGGASLSSFAVCLVLGAYFNSLKLQKLSYPIQFFIGCAILFFTRPYEGGVFVIAVLFCIFFDVLKNKINFKTSKAFIFIGIISTVLIFSLQGFYNYKVTGSYTTLPYQEHVNQYMHARIFAFLDAKTPDISPTNQILKKLYSQWEMQEFNKVKSMNFFENLKYSFERIFNVSGFLVYFLMSIIFCVFYTKSDEVDKKLIFMTSLTILASSIIPWKANHYMFAMIVLMIFFILKTIVGFLAVAKNDKSIISFFKKYKILIGVILIFYIIIGIYMNILVQKRIKEQNSKNIENYVVNWTGDKQKIISELEKSSQLNLVFVRYKDYVKSGEEEIFDNPSLYDSTLGFVYNYKSDIDSNTTVFAHDLGEAENKKLIEYYKAKKENRAVWILDLSNIKDEYKVLSYK